MKHNTAYAHSRKYELVKFAFVDKWAIGEKRAKMERLKDLYIKAIENRK
ncbi:hypothetical protein RJD24_07445 [Bacillaceae bacterium IKA-2]|nr:hypothetical protein RJD24_07445 [Bacillaceae bacterium IKA-2]